MIDYLIESEMNNENIFILKNISKEINTFLEQLVEKFKTLINQPLNVQEEKQITDQINLEIDDIKGKVLEADFYADNFEKGSYEKKKILNSLNMYIKKMESNMKYLEDNKENYELQKMRFKEVEDQYPQEVSKLIDDNHRLNDLLNIKDRQRLDLQNLYQQKEMENYEYIERFNGLNYEIVNLKIENEKLLNQISQIKSDYDGFVENVDILEKEEYMDTITDLPKSEFKKNYTVPIQINHMLSDTNLNNQNMNLNNTDRNMDSNLSTTITSNTYNTNANEKGHSKLNRLQLAQRSQSLHDIDFETYDTLHQLTKVENYNKTLEEKVTSLQKMQDYYQQKIYILESENERIIQKYTEEAEVFNTSNNELLDKNDHNDQNDPNYNLDTFNPLDGLSALGNDSILITQSDQKISSKTLRKESTRSDNDLVNLSSLCANDSILISSKNDNKYNISQSKGLRRISKLKTDKSDKNLILINLHEAQEKKYSSPNVNERNPNLHRSFGPKTPNMDISPLNIRPKKINKVLNRFISPLNSPKKLDNYSDLCFTPPKKEKTDKFENFQSNKAYYNYKDYTIDNFSLVLLSIKVKKELEPINTKFNNNIINGNNNNNPVSRSSNINFINEGLIVVGGNYTKDHHEKHLEKIIERKNTIEKEHSEHNKHKDSNRNRTLSDFTFCMEASGETPKSTQKSNQVLQTSTYNAAINSTSVMNTYHDIGDAISSQTTISTFDFIDAEDDKVIKFIIERNNDKLKENTIFSDNVFLYDSKFVKSKEYYYFIVSSHFIYVINNKKENMLVCNKIKDLYKVTISNTNCNLICLHFYEASDILIETYRVTNLLYFLRDLFIFKGEGKLKLKSTSKFILKINSKITKYMPLSHGLNLSCCYKFGYVEKYIPGFFKNKFIECFLVLSDMGLFLFDIPICSCPKRIINIVGGEVINVRYMITIIILIHFRYLMNTSINASIAWRLKTLKLMIL